MSSRIIITAGLGVPLSTGASTILFDAWTFILYYFDLLYIYNRCPYNIILMHVHILYVFVVCPFASTGAPQGHW